MPQAHSAAVSLHARRMSHLRWSKVKDRTAATKPGRDGLLRRFELQVDPDGTLDPAERAKRAENARRAFYADLALKSAAARRARKVAAGQELQRPTGHRQGCQLPEDHTSECRRASSPNGRS
jgi:hypothetical protein